LKLIVAAVGRLKPGPERALQEHYCERIGNQGRPVHLSPLEIIELTESRDKSAGVRKANEAKRLLEATATASYRVALDERGKAHDSRSFANVLARHRDGGASGLAFMLGGPDGHARDLLESSDTRLTLSAMTLPHGLARLVLLEQIYRAMTILAGHPYHRS